MPIKEKSFRIGCGRYLQEKGILSSLGDEVLRFGKVPFIVGGETALSKTVAIIEKSLKEKCEKYKIVCHKGPCSHEVAKELCEVLKNDGCDVVIGVGGGIIMDFAKLIGFYANIPVINVPTSSATCACYTPLSVCYSPEGRTVGSKHYEYEVNAVIADTEIISTQPKRLLLAGIFDALAKFIEIKQRFNDDVTDFALGLDWAYTLSKKTFSYFCENTEKCIEDMEKGNISDTVERIIFASLATTGVISGIARGSNQTAIGHKFYEGTRKMFFENSKQYLHGEIVGVGLLLQNYFNGEAKNNDFLISLMKKYNMPSNIKEIGLKGDDSEKNMYYEYLKNSSALEDATDEQLKTLRDGIDYLWNLI